MNIFDYIKEITHEHVGTLEANRLREFRVQGKRYFLASGLFNTWNGANKSCSQSNLTMAKPGEEHLNVPLMAFYKSLPALVKFAYYIFYDNFDDEVSG